MVGKLLDDEHESVRDWIANYRNAMTITQHPKRKRSRSLYRIKREERVSEPLARAIQYGERYAKRKC